MFTQYYQLKLEELSRAPDCKEDALVFVTEPTAFQHPEEKAGSDSFTLESLTDRIYQKYQQQELKTILQDTRRQKDYFTVTELAGCFLQAFIRRKLDEIKETHNYKFLINYQHISPFSFFYKENGNHLHRILGEEIKTMLPGTEVKLESEMYIKDIHLKGRADILLPGDKVIVEIKSRQKLHSHLVQAQLLLLLFNYSKEDNPAFQKVCLWYFYSKEIIDVVYSKEQSINLINRIKLLKELIDLPWKNLYESKNYLKYLKSLKETRHCQYCPYDCSVFFDNKDYYLAHKNKANEVAEDLREIREGKNFFLF